MRTYEFTQVDVFTRRALEGNPLAVFASGAGLSTARMQAIAREMNLSETTFLFPGGAGADARVRIFTPGEELPFAGHPTLGTAFVLAQSRPGQSEIRLRMKIGVIPVQVIRRGKHTFLEMRQKDPVFGRTAADVGQLAAALGLSDIDIDKRYQPQVVSTGVPFLIVPLGSRGALARLEPRAAQLRPLLAKLGCEMPYYLVTGGSGLEARMFMLDHSFEDPGTGSAAGCAAAFLVRYGRQAPDRPFVIRQGRFVQRPNEIRAQASLADGRVANVRVGGYVVEVLKGRLRL